MDELFRTASRMILTEVRERKPLVHLITNYVTVNDCANIVLALGAAPVMADEIDEVDEIVSHAAALVLNIGTLNGRTIGAMLAAGKKANEREIPVVLDPVGAGASALRTKTAARLIQEVKPAVIRGNISEIKVISGRESDIRGVDADEGAAVNLSFSEKSKLAVELAKNTGSVIAVTGAVDLVTDGKKVCFIRNGHSMMTRVTGTGCMLTALIGSCCGVTDDYWAAAATAVMVMGLAGERAFAKVKDLASGTGGFRSFLIDEVSRMTPGSLAEGGKINFERFI